MKLTDGSIIISYIKKITLFNMIFNYLIGDLMVRTWDQGVCFSCGFRFKPCDC
jgi:hypothetical protein